MPLYEFRCRCRHGRQTDVWVETLTNDLEAQERARELMLEQTYTLIKIRPIVEEQNPQPHK